MLIDAYVEAHSERMMQIASFGRKRYLSVLTGADLVIGNSSSGIIEAPAVVFESQHDVLPAFDAGLLDKDCVVVVRHQGPKANGMPELHKLMPPLGVLLDRRFKIALVTDGRLSGASGKVPSAIHVTPEAYDGGLLAKVRDGDMIRVNGQTGELTLLVDDAELAARQPHIPDLSASRVGTGREMFGALRENLSGAEQGATCITF